MSRKKNGGFLITDMDWIDKIHLGEAQQILKEMPNNSVDLVVTSPPYNLGVDYDGYDDDILKSEYRLLIKDTFLYLDRVVKDDGRVCVNISLKNDGKIIDTPSIIKKKADIFDWDLRFEIIWNKGMSESSSAWGSWRSPSSPRPIFNHEYIFIFDVGEGKKNSEKTISKDRFMNLVKSVWNVKPDSGSDHPSTFPEEIPRRLIELNSYEGDVVLDPFIGSGTTAVVAEKMNRDWIGIDISEKYVDMSYDRIEKECDLEFEDRSIFNY
jgi:site-specific DNA-methyltransferase (adenine-specific)